jgi:hypothetical protein
VAWGKSVVLDGRNQNKALGFGASASQQVITAAP